MRRKLLPIFILLSFLLPSARAEEYRPPVIAEVMSCFTEEETALLSGTGGWAELYNATETESYTRGLFWRAADADERFALPEAELGPGERAVFALPEALPLGPGSTLLLTDEAGTVVSSCALPAETGGRSCGDGTVFLYPTPGRENAPAYADVSLIPPYPEHGVYISEVSSSGDDEWVELKNGGSAPVSLNGWRLSKEDEGTDHLTLKGEIAPGGYAVFSMPLSSSGETVSLTGPDGSLRDSFSTGAVPYGMSSGRADGKRLFFEKPTPGEANTAKGLPAFAPQPVFSEQGLYRTEPFTLSITAAGGAEIRYTLDGSVPTEKSKLYTEPIPIDGSVTVRARAFAEGVWPGGTATAHYLFTEPHTVPVVCVAMSPKAFSSVYGVSERDELREKESYIIFYETDGTMGTEFPCLLRAKGRGSLVYAQKSLTVKLRARTGQKSVGYPFFGAGINEGIKYRSLCLRAGGQDIRSAVFRDTLIQRAAKDTAVDTVETRFAVLYVNGAYYGLYTLEEEMNADYYVSRYGADKDRLDVIKQDKYVRSGNKKAYQSFISKLNKYDGSDSGLASLAELMDVDAFTDYAAIRIIAGSSDVLNQKVVSARDGSLLWRPMLFDDDSAFGSRKSDVTYSYFKSSGFTASGSKKVLSSNTVFRALYSNKAWRKRFAERTVELMETSFSEEALNRLIDGLVAEMAPEMPRQIKRFRFHGAEEEWLAAVERLRGVIGARKEIVYGQLKTYFRVSDEELAAWAEKYRPAEQTSAPANEETET